MSIKIDDHFMSLEVDGCVLATAYERSDGWWEVTAWPRYFDRNRAITALSLAERLWNGYGDDDPHVIAWRKELAP